jgi:DNA-binding transcriptional MerR regulator
MSVAPARPGRAIGSAPLGAAWPVDPAGRAPPDPNLYVNGKVGYHERVPTPNEAEPAPARLLRIQEVAAELALTTRSIRYYEEIGLLAPVARSEGAYRLYDADDLERLHFIKGLRDDAGFSLAEIGLLLEDEAARSRNRARFAEAQDPDERRAIVHDALTRVDRQAALLRAKIERLGAMVVEADARRDHLREHLASVEAEARGDLAAAEAHDRAAHVGVAHNHAVSGRAVSGRPRPSDRARAR